MQDGKVAERDIELQKEIAGIIQKRKPAYGGVKVVTALKKEGNGWRNVLSRLEILAKDDMSRYDALLNYGDFQIRQTRIGLDQFLATLEALINKGEFSVPNNTTLPMEGSLQKDGIPSWHYHPSNDVVFNIGWPANLFIFQPTEKFKSGPPGDVLIALDMPLFDNGWAAIRSVFKTDVQRYSQYMGTILFLIPNFAAKITQTKIKSNQLALSVLAKETTIDDLIAKISCESTPRSFQTEVGFTGNTVELPLEFTPDLYTIYLLSKKTGEPLDYRRFGLSWTDLPEDIVFDVGPADIEQKITLGENEEVEFKQEIPKDREDLARTIVAFANTYGGIIFLGVSDDGSTKGILDSKIEDTTQNIVRQYTEPPIEIKTTRHEVQNQTVVLIHVKEGIDKPYTVRGKGVFIRAGATDRVATRDELDAFYSERQQQIPRDISSALRSRRRLA